MSDLPRRRVCEWLGRGLRGLSVCFVEFLEAPAIFQAMIRLEVALVVLVHVKLAGAFKLVVE